MTPQEAAAFFDRDAQVVACALLGRVLCHEVTPGVWLRARIVETEAYYRAERASHASLGDTEKRRALFMAPGTVYMYYARGGDSFNVSCRGPGNAVLVKAGLPWVPDEEASDEAPAMLARMHANNPLPSGAQRAEHRLCAGQTLLCRALGLRVPDWDGRPLGGRLCLLDTGYRPQAVLRARRLGIPAGRDGHLPYRFVDAAHAAASTRNPRRRGAEAGRDYALMPVPPCSAGSGTGAEGDTEPDWAALLRLPPSQLLD